MLDTIEAAQRVEKGAALLDQRLEHWVDDIDLGEFDIANGDACILGQLFGEYDRGRDNLLLPPFGLPDYASDPDGWLDAFKAVEAAAVAHGFNLGDGDQDDDDANDVLESAWVGYITVHRSRTH